jgi:hypothetical protein
MISLAKFFSATIDSTSHRILKVFGMVGTGNADQVAPFGDDSCPVQGMDAIYMDTANDDLPVIVGFINTNQMAAPGEKRFFSMKQNEDGSYSEAFYTWMKADGTYEIGGNVDNSVRYAALNAALQTQIAKMELQLTEIAAGIATAGGSYTPGDITLDISAAKINEIKTL